MSKIEIEVPQYQDTMFPHEWDIITSEAQFTVVVAHRRARKTTSILNRALIESQKKPAGIIYVVFPKTVMARDVIWRDPKQIDRVIPQQLIKKKREQEMNIEMVGGSVIAIRGSDDIDRLTGTGGKAYFLDEYSIMKPEVFRQAIFPVVKENKGKIVLSGTPRGKNHFYQEFLRGNDPNYPEWKSIYLPATKTQVLSPEEIENLRQEMPQRLFDQEIMCEWLSSGGVVFRGVKEASTLSPQQPVPGKNYIIGVDLARLQDYTSISVFDWNSNNMVFLHRMKELDYTFQSKRIAAIAKQYNNALVVMEQNNVGDAVIDLTQRQGIAVEPFMTTAPSKKQIIEKLSLYIESKKIGLLNDPILINELESFGYTMTARGNVQYGATVGHDDTVISTALAVNKLFPLDEKKTKPEEQSKISNFREQLIERQQPDFIEEELWAEWGGDYDEPIGEAGELSKGERTAWQGILDKNFNKPFGTAP